MKSSVYTEPRVNNRGESIQPHNISSYKHCLESEVTGVCYECARYDEMLCVPSLMKVPWCKTLGFKICFAVL